MTTLNGSFSGFINGWGPDWWGEEDPNIADRGDAYFNLSTYTNGTFSNVSLNWDYTGYAGEVEAGQRWILSDDSGTEFHRHNANLRDSAPRTTGIVASLAAYLNAHLGNASVQFQFNCDAGDYYDGNWSLLTGMNSPSLSFTWTPSGGQPVHRIEPIMMGAGF